MRKVVYFLVMLLLFFLTFQYKDNILVYYNKYFNGNKETSQLIKNQYYRYYNFKYVSNTDNFNPQDRQDILNIYYTVINSGMDNFNFYCPSEYKNCLSDVLDIAKNQVVISNINNFVHPYNGFKDLNTQIDYSTNKVTLDINHNYTEDMKVILNYRIDEIIKEYLTDDLTDREKIKIIHDYIINNTKYDSNRSDNNIIEYDSDIAYGVLIQGYGLCSGYTDSMMLFLEKLGIKSYKVSSDNHVWNKVYLDGNWLNLDLTWDDPINLDKDLLVDNFFLIDDKQMFSLDKTEHLYDKNVY